MPTQDLALYWNGAAITGTFGDFDRSLVKVPMMGAPDIAVASLPAVQSDGAVATLDPSVESRRFSTLLMSEYTGASTDYNELERELREEWQTVQGVFNPHLGAKEARFDRQDTTPATVSRVVQAYVVHCPAFIQAFKGGSSFDVGARWGDDGSTNAWLIYPLEFLALAPHFRDRSVAAAQTKDIDVQASPPSAVTLRNEGIDEVGVRVEVTAVTTSGITEFSLTNDDTGDSITVKKLSGSFAVNDYVDWMHTDPCEVEFSDDVAVVNGSDFISAVNADDATDGDNDYSTTLGAGSGDITLTLSIYRKWLTT